MELKVNKYKEQLSMTGAPDNRIATHVEYGQHIELTCVNHPTKVWSTKNIQHIGARNIFYNLNNIAGMGEECDCPVHCLKPIQPE